MDPICGPNLNPNILPTLKCGLEVNRSNRSHNCSLADDVYYDMCDCMCLCVGRLQCHKSEFICMLEVCG